MDENMTAWLRNAIVHNARRDISNLPVFLEHNRVPGFVGMARVRDRYDEAVIRTVPSTAGGNTTVVDELTAGDEVAVIGQDKGPIGDIPDQPWVAINWNGTKRWMARFLLDMSAIPGDVPTPPEEVWSDFDGDFSRASGEEFFFDLVRHFDEGVGNDS
ncbi:MAG: hypothetical protein OXG78_08715 [Chloroflexi bacterium]|nr:hypothetical protein [Chloroflexota bacterium]